MVFCIAFLNYMLLQTMLLWAESQGGGVAEWLKAADCKSAHFSVRRFESYLLHGYAGIAQW